MLKIKTVSIRNFKSYGDYTTTINLASLGPVLITGKVGEDPRDRNGAGKSTIVDSIVWALFGKSPGLDRPPADNVVNWQTGKDCSVTIETIDGYQITRTRAVDGHNDLLIKGPGNVDISDSTNQNTQLHIKKLFGLDYDIFMNSTFFGQFSKPFLELRDQKRKEALERLLGLSKFEHYVDVAAEKIDAAEKDQIKFKTETEQIDRDILKTTQAIEGTYQEEKNYEIKRADDIKSKQSDLDKVNDEYAEIIKKTRDKIEVAKKELSDIKTFDIPNLEVAWNHHKLKIDVAERATKVLQTTREDIITSEKTITGLESPDNSIAILKSNCLKTKGKHDAIVEEPLLPVSDLEKEWSEYERKRKGAQNALDIVTRKLNDLKSEVKFRETETEKWSAKIGATCPTCRQIVQKDHVLTLNAEISSDKTEMADNIQLCQKAIDKYKSILEELQKPSMTMQEAILINKQRQSLIDSKKVLWAELSEQMHQLGNAIDKEKQKNVDLETERRNLNRLRSVEETWVTKEKTARTEVEESRPKTSIDEARSREKQYNGKLNEISTYEQSIIESEKSKERRKEEIRTTIREITNTTNPYTTIIKNRLAELEQIKKNHAESKKKLDQYDSLIEHITYIKQSYSDRRKIKSFLLQRLIPYFNERIKYYLKALNCDFDIEFNSSLQSKTNKWPYEMRSGGERRRIDLSIMFAQYDLVISVYEKQSNILVFDEVDPRLDPKGIQALVDVLYKEFIDPTNRSKPDTIIVISHKDEMRDAFPTKILVRKQNDLSRIEEIR